MKVILLDFDGPMIPGRSYILPGNRVSGHFVTQFDPIAAMWVEALLRVSGAKLVISSTWRRMGREAIATLLLMHGIDPNHLHDDWCTPQGVQRRCDEIKAWLKNHPEVTHYAAIDDDIWEGDLPGGVVIPFEDGMQRDHIRQISILLDVDPDDRKFLDPELLFGWHAPHMEKRREIDAWWRVYGDNVDPYFR